jgi:hypothetical protein
MKLTDTDGIQGLRSQLPKSRLHLQLAGNDQLADKLSWAYNEAMFLALKAVRNLEELNSVEGALKALMAKRRIVEAEVEAYGVGLRYGHFLQIPQELWDSCKQKPKWREAAEKVGEPALAEDDDVRDAIVRLKAVTQQIGELRRSKARLTESLERLPRDPKEVRALAAKAMRAVSGGHLRSPFIRELLKLVEESPYLARSRRAPRQESEEPVAEVRQPQAVQEPAPALVACPPGVHLHWDGEFFAVHGEGDEIPEDVVRTLIGTREASGVDLKGKWGTLEVRVTDKSVGVFKDDALQDTYSIE